ARLSKVQCIYETLKGWDEDITEITNFDDLPAGAKKYVILLEEMTKTPVAIIGVGPKRNQTIFR
ncbi:MAG: adenylosuccinate synthetase, partial [Planctomycetota bacterium]